jgi:hypothetical protein
LKIEVREHLKIEVIEEKGFWGEDLFDQVLQALQSSSRNP